MGLRWGSPIGAADEAANEAADGAADGAMLAKDDILSWYMHMRHWGFLIPQFSLRQQRRCFRK
jgi:hypothetical protein